MKSQSKFEREMFMRKDFQVKGEKNILKRIYRNFKKKWILGRSKRRGGLERKESKSWLTMHQLVFFQRRIRRSNWLVAFPIDRFWLIGFM